MKKITILFGLACLLSGALQAADDSKGEGVPLLGDDALLEEAHDDPTSWGVVEGASYWAYAGTQGKTLVRQEMKKLKHRVKIFYDADGNELKRTADPHSKTDPSALGAKVATVKIRYWKGRNRKERGKYLVCFDKHRNIIYSPPCTVRDGCSPPLGTVTLSIGGHTVFRHFDSSKNLGCSNYSIKVEEFPFDLTEAVLKEGYAYRDEQAAEAESECCTIL